MLLRRGRWWWDRGVRSPACTPSRRWQDTTRTGDGASLLLLLLLLSQTDVLQLQIPVEASPAKLQGPDLHT